MHTHWRPQDRVLFVAGGVNIMLGVLFILDGPIGYLQLILGLWICLMPVWRRHAFNHGWMSGRAQMVAGLYESAHRGYTVEDWLRAEAERDLAALPPAVLRRLQRE